MLLEPSTRIDGDAAAWEAPRLSVALVFEGPTVELWLAGRLDASSLVAFRTQLEQFCFESYEEIVVHAEDVDDLDAAGRVALDSLGTTARDRGARFRLLGLDPRFRAEEDGPRGC